MCAAKDSSRTIPLGRYMWERIKQVGVSSIFGVPGAFNLTLLDHIYPFEDLEWVGNTNDLNAGYAADGYARVKNGAGCVVTTHGVGELSALNAIAGAMTEHVKVIHVVGQTSRAMQTGRVMTHHSIGDSPDHQVFNVASQNFRVAAAELHKATDPTREIDRVLRECFVHSKPVYIFMPTDLVEQSVDATLLHHPLDLTPPFDQASVDSATTAILDALYASKRPSLFVDCLVQQHGAVAECRRLADALKIPVFTSNMGKGIIDETLPYYVGVCNGDPSAPGVKPAMQSCDLRLMLGDLPCDTNNGGFSRPVHPNVDVYINPHDVRVCGQAPITVPIRKILDSLARNLDNSRQPRPGKVGLPEKYVDDDSNSDRISHSWLWDHFSRTFLQPNDVLIGESGTTSYGIPGAIFPANTHWITQGFYSSIGFATPAAFGGDMALRELASTSRGPRGRTILVTGDGSLMLTIQEIGNMIKHKTAPVIFIINNAGFTVERVVHGPHQSYNDIVPFDYKHMLQFFNMSATDAARNFHRATTRAEMEQILELESVRSPIMVQVIEIIMDKMDVPWRLTAQVAMQRDEAALQAMAEAGFKMHRVPQGEDKWH